MPAMLEGHVAQGAHLSATGLRLLVVTYMSILGIYAQKWLFLKDEPLRKHPAFGDRRVCRVQSLYGTPLPLTDSDIIV